MGFPEGVGPARGGSGPRTPPDYPLPCGGTPMAGGAAAAQRWARVGGSGLAVAAWPEALRHPTPAFLELASPRPVFSTFRDPRPETRAPAFHISI